MINRTLYNVNTDILANALKAQLHPEIYDQDISPSGNLDFLLLRKGGLPGARYAFGFKTIDDDSVHEVFEKARRDAASLTKSMWLFRETGLYLVLCGPESIWENGTAQAPVDRTGLHTIIVQAVHFIDPQTGADHINQSAWGPVHFGGVDSIADLVRGAFRKNE